MRIIQLMPLIFLLDACIDPLAVTVISPKAELVVDGLITDDPPPYRVKLLYSSKPDTTTLKRPTVETGAYVWLVNDDSNESELLAEIDTARGTYISSPTGLQGQIGKHYSVRVITAIGKEYTSAPQEMLAAGTIDAVYAQFTPNALILKGSDPSDAFSVFVDAHGESEGSSLFRWRWTGTYKGQTFPERRITFFQRPGPPAPGLRRDPEPCSGYIFGADFVFHKVAECTCCFCWVTENSKSAKVSENRFAGDNRFNHVEVAKIAVTPFHFYERYYIEVEQLSLSKEAYEFWKLAQAQQQSAGSLFQPNSIKVKGNIKCLTNPNEEVLGVFSVSGITRKSLSITREQVPVYIPPIDTLPINCMQGLYGDASTNYKPIFW